MLLPQSKSMARVSITREPILSEQRSRSPVKTTYQGETVHPHTQYIYRLVNIVSVEFRELNPDGERPVIDPGSNRFPLQVHIHSGKGQAMPKSPGKP